LSLSLSFIVKRIPGPGIPGLQLRSYLEGKADLTLPTLRRILHSHYQEKNATELYQQLTAEAQHAKETQRADALANERENTPHLLGCITSEF